VNEKERRYWQDMVDEYCCRDGQCERCAAILAADAIVRAAREYVRASYLHLTEPTDTPPTAITSYQIDAFQRLVAAVGELKG
jgi:hypothetical protein